MDKLLFQNEVEKVLHKKVLVSDILDFIGRIYSPLNFGNMKGGPHRITKGF